MNWKLCTLFISVLLPLSVAASVADNGPVSGIASLREKYLRPAEIPYPDEDPYSAVKAKLGRSLFFDPIFPFTTLIFAICRTSHLSIRFQLTE